MPDTRQMGEQGFYLKIYGFDDDIEAWGKSVGLTLDEALECGVRSPDDGEPYVEVPVELVREIGTDR